MKIALRRRRASAKLSDVEVRSYGSTRDVGDTPQNARWAKAPAPQLRRWAVCSRAERVFRGRLFRQRWVDHAHDTPDLEAGRIGVGFCNPFLVGAFVIDCDHAEQLLFRRIGAEPVIAARKLSDSVHRDPRVARDFLVIRQVERGRAIAFHDELDHASSSPFCRSLLSSPLASNLPYSSPQPSKPGLFSRENRSARRIASGVCFVNSS